MPSHVLAILVLQAALNVGNAYCGDSKIANSATMIAKPIPQTSGAIPQKGQQPNDMPSSVFQVCLDLLL